MHPVLIRIYGIPIYSYGFFLALAFLVCLILITRRSLSIGIPPHNILDLGLYIIISGVIGARLLYVITNSDYYIMRPAEIILLNKGGLVFYGGFIAALIIGVIVVKKRKLPILKITDLFVVFLPLGQAIGRLGCFMNGCCYGKPTESIFGIKFPECSFAANEFGINASVYPAQVFSAIADLVIFFILIFRMKYKKYDGQIVIYYMFLYGAARFLLEYTRADNPVIFYGLNVPQIISVILIITALILGVLNPVRTSRGIHNTLNKVS